MPTPVSGRRRDVAVAGREALAGNERRPRTEAAGGGKDAVANADTGADCGQRIARADHVLVDAARKAAGHVEWLSGCVQAGACGHRGRQQADGGRDGHVMSWDVGPGSPACVARPAPHTRSAVVAQGAAVTDGVCNRARTISRRSGQFRVRTRASRAALVFRCLRRGGTLARLLKVAPAVSWASGMAT